MGLKQETVVVVGATGEMGRVICAELVAQQYDVLAVARSESDLQAMAEAMPSLRSCVTDIADDGAESDISRSLQGPVRAVVHGPGVATAGGVLSALTSALVDAVNIKVGGMVRLVRACDGNLVQGARLIAIGGHYGFEPSAYAATAGVANAALANLIRQYSWAYGERGITAHLIAPGPADTPRLHRVAAARAERDGTSTETILATMKAESALGEFTSVESIAWAVTTLLSPHANALGGGTLFMDSARRRGLP